MRKMQTSMSLRGAFASCNFSRTTSFPRLSDSTVAFFLVDEYNIYWGQMVAQMQISLLHKKSRYRQNNIQCQYNMCSLITSKDLFQSRLGRENIKHWIWAKLRMSRHILHTFLFLCLIRNYYFSFYTRIQLRF